MAVKLTLVPAPEGVRGHTTTFQFEPKGAFPDVPIAQFPFVSGDIKQFHGWLEGLGHDAVNGRIEMVLHEGLFAVSGELEVYFPYTYHNVNIILGMVERTAIGLGNQYPKSHFRIKVEYKSQWRRGEEGAGHGSRLGSSTSRPSANAA